MSHITLRDFITQREAEIRVQQKALKAEARELQLAKAALDGQPGGAITVAGSHTSAPLTIKDMARKVLADAPNGLTSSGILDAIKKMFDRDIERTSLSPQLSRLKDEGLLVLSGETWFTKENHAAWETAILDKAISSFEQWEEMGTADEPAEPDEPHEPDDPGEDPLEEEDGIIF